MKTTLLWLALAVSMSINADQTYYDGDMNVIGYERSGHYYDDDMDYQGMTTGSGMAWDEDGDYAGRVYGDPGRDPDPANLLIYPD